MRKIIARNKKYLLLVGIIIGLGVIIGFFYYQFLSSDTKLNIINTIKDANGLQNNGIIKDLIIMSLLLVMSFLIIGMPFSIFYLFYEGISNGFIISIFLDAFNLPGLIFILLYILVNNILILFLMVIFVRKLINISRYMIGLIIYRKDNILKEKIIWNFQNSLYILVFVLIINIILYFISPLIFNNLKTILIH